MLSSLNPLTKQLPAPAASNPFVANLTDRVCKRLAFLLILASVLFHLVYLVLDCPLGLAPDEAHYWQWSRHLAWSYYSKGPLVAWLIRASCEVFGPLSESLVGSPMLAVRIPAVISHAALLSGWYVLTASTLKSHRAALAMVAMALAFPAVMAIAFIMTIDPPFLALWCWAAVGVWKGLERQPTPPTPFPKKEGGEEQKTKDNSTPPAATTPPSLPGKEAGGLGLSWWLLAAVCSAFGVMAKYPMVLLPCGVFGYLLFYRRAELLRPGFWLFVLGNCAGLLPVFIWNAANDWVTFKHVGTQAVGTSDSGFRWLGPLRFAGEQAAFLIGAWFVVWVCAAWKYRRDADLARAFLWWSSVPVWSVFALASFKTTGQINWPAASYITGLVLCLAWIREQLNGTYSKAVSRLVSCGLAIGLALCVLVHYPALMRSALVAVAGPPTEKDPTPIRKYDPTARLRGWKTLTTEIDEIRARVRNETGEEPLVAGTVWNVPGMLGAYCEGHPETYSFGLAMADRHSQYDLWHPNPIDDAQVFQGRSFVFVGDGLPANSGVFERVEFVKLVVHREEGVPVAVWWVWIGYNFRGFPEKPLYPRQDRY